MKQGGCKGGNHDGGGGQGDCSSGTHIVRNEEDSTHSGGGGGANILKLGPRMGAAETLGTSSRRIGPGMGAG